MKKTIIITLILIMGFAGFLAYDWHKKTTIQKDDQRVTLYSWTDQEGAKHFTDTQPPNNARNVEALKGFEYVDRPLVMKIKDKTIAAYRWAKERLFKKKDRKKKKRQVRVHRFRVHRSGLPLFIGIYNYSRAAFANQR